MTKYLEWVIGGDTGISSKVIWSVMMGVRQSQTETTFHLRQGVPLDPSDFGRCHRLLCRFPEWRLRLYEVAEQFPSWAPFVEHWDKMTHLYERDLSTGKSKELYKLMGRLVKETPNDRS